MNLYCRCVFSAEPGVFAKHGAWPASPLVEFQRELFHTRSGPPPAVPGTPHGAPRVPRPPPEHGRTTWRCGVGERRGVAGVGTSKYPMHLQSYLPQKVFGPSKPTPNTFSEGHTPPVVPPQVRHDWTRQWHPRQFHLRNEGRTGGQTGMEMIGIRVLLVMTDQILFSRRCPMPWSS